MSNTYQLLLVSIPIIMLAIFILVLVIMIISSNNSSSSNQVSSFECSDMLSGVEYISDQGCCSGLGNVKYNSTLKVNMSPSIVSYQTVCKAFCAGSYDTETDICTDDTQENIDLVNNCILSIKPVNCIGETVPLGISNGIIYYAIEANTSGCVQETCEF